MSNAVLHLTGPLGESLSVETTDQSRYATLAQWGALGYHSGVIPRGGLILPHENEHDFNWALLAARPWTNPEGEMGVMCRGHFWKRRELAAVDSKKMTLPAAIKYSRGAKPSDPEEVREKSDGEIEYVTLVIFKGGKRQEQWATGGQKASRPTPAQSAPEEELPPLPNEIGPDGATKLKDHLRTRLPNTEYAEHSFIGFASLILDRQVDRLENLTLDDGRAVATAATRAMRNAQGAA